MKVKTLLPFIHGLFSAPASELKAVQALVPQALKSLAAKLHALATSPPTEADSSSLALACSNAVFLALEPSPALEPLVVAVLHGAVRCAGKAAVAVAWKWGLRSKTRYVAAAGQCS